MSQELKSFLIAVSIIVAITLFVPCIEAIAKALRRGSRPVTTVESTAKSPEKFTGEAA